VTEMKVQSLERAFDILELLARESGGLSLAETARRVGLPRSTTFRLLSVLRRREYVRKSENESDYRLGPGFIELSSIYLNNLELKTESAPAMKELASALGTIVFLACRQGSKMVYIDKHDKFPSLRKYAIIGQQKPLYSTALGKALSLDMSEEELRSLLADEPFRAFGPNTHRSFETFFADVAESRARAWTRDDEEGEAGVNCVAAPIRDYRGWIVSAISTSWSTELRPELEAEKVAQLVVKAAANISRSMGWLGNEAAML
jgi:IclR family transcriptional regulator, KDG regulon repressor